jgi:hypothetical protein
MWAIFTRNEYMRSYRSKARAERKLHRARKRAWKRNERAEVWNRFVTRLAGFLEHPFAKKEVTEEQREIQETRRFKKDPYAKSDRLKTKREKQEMHAEKKAWQLRESADARRRFKARLNNFIAHPFAKKQLTDFQSEALHIRKLVRHEEKLARRKWWIKFRKHPLKALFPAKKQRIEGGGYLYVYNMTRLEQKELARKQRKEKIENLKLLLASPDLRRKFGFGYLHSTAFFILAFMLIYIVYQVVTIGIAASYNIPVLWYYYELKFPLYTFSPLYTRAAMVMIFSSGPVISLMLAFTFLKLFFVENVFLKRFQLFYLWGFIAGANMFFGAYIAGFFTRTEFIYTSEWLFMSQVFDIEEIVFTAISFIMMLIIGRIVTPLFLSSSGSVTLITPQFRFFFIITQVILPWFSGAVILFLITLPHYYIPLVIKTLTPGLVLFPSMYLYNLLQYEDIHKKGVIQRNYLRWSVIIAVVAILFFYRVILSFGLRL